MAIRTQIRFNERSRKEWVTISLRISKPTAQRYKQLVKQTDLTGEDILNYINSELGRIKYMEIVQKTAKSKKIV